MNTTPETTGHRIVREYRDRDNGFGITGTGFEQLAERIDAAIAEAQRAELESGSGRDELEGMDSAGV